MDGSIAQIQTAKPTVRRYSAARHTRDLADIRMLKVRVLDATRLRDDLTDFAAGNRLVSLELKTALANPLLQYSATERKHAQAEIDSCQRLEDACREELAAL